MPVGEDIQAQVSVRGSARRRPHPSRAPGEWKAESQALPWSSRKRGPSASSCASARWTGSWWCPLPAPTFLPVCVCQAEACSVVEQKAVKNLQFVSSYKPCLSGRTWGLWS